MLRVGLTGGIGAGKSTAARLLAGAGAVVIDADVLAREVVAPGTDGLMQVLEAFGEQVLAQDGGLDRVALGHLVFTDRDARLRLNAIVHPRVRRRTQELMEDASADAIIVNDVPLLVEAGLAPTYHLVLVVDAPRHIRIERLVRDRAMTVEDASARIRSQAEDDVRLAAADVRLDNGGTPQRLAAQVADLWEGRLRPFADGLSSGSAAPRPFPLPLVDARTDWKPEAARLADRIGWAVGGLPVDHIGSTAVPGLPARDVIDLLVTVEASSEFTPVGQALAAAGFVPASPPALPGRVDPAAASVARFANTDPGRHVDLYLAARGSAWRARALACRDWLRAEAEARIDFARLKTGVPGDDYVRAKDSWFASAPRAIAAWAERGR